MYISKDVCQLLTTWHANQLRILDVCEVLIDFYGIEAEFSSFQMSSKQSLWALDWLSKMCSSHTTIGLNELPEKPSGSIFVCDVKLARIVTPLFEVICSEYESPAVEIRKICSGSNTDSLLLPLAHYYSSFAVSVVAELWKRYPELSPHGWPT